MKIATAIITVKGETFEKRVTAEEADRLSRKFGDKITINYDLWD